MRIFTLIFIVIILLMGISFSILNANIVSFHYYFGVAKLPLSLLLTVTFILGLFVGLLVIVIPFFRAKITQRRLRTQLNLAKKEIQHLQQQLSLEDK